MSERKNQVSPHRGPGQGPQMGMPTEKARDFKGTLRRLLTYMKPFKLALVAVFVTAIIGTVFQIVGPKVMGLATTKLFEGLMMKLSGVTVDFEYVGYILLWLLFLYVISAVFNYIQQFIMAGISQKIVYNMRQDVNQKLSRLPLRFYDARAHGDILSRVTNDVDNISTTLQQSMTQLMTAIITIVGVVVMMLSISPLLTLVTVLTLPLYILTTRPIIKRSQKFFTAQQKSLGKLNGHVEEMYTGHPIVKAFGKEESAIKTFEEINDELYDSGWKSQFISGIIMPMMNLLSNLGYVFVCVIGGILVTRRTIQIGDVQAFIQYVRQFTQPLSQVANISNIIQSTVASAERVFELLEEEEETKEALDSQVINQPQGNIRFEHVKFGYKQGVTIIKDMNVDVKKGQTVAIVGPTGAGKTTLVNLLMRFYDLNEGTITIDGVNIMEIRRADLRSLFGMVLQDTWLFNGTIKDNIAYGRENATFEDIVEAAKAAHAHHFIKTLPEGYETVLNEEVTNISQGQKQLLTIARAILADPAILILDEATSSVDTRTEIYIQKAMERLMEGRTSFVIAHRLSTIKEADVILVMDKGDVIEKGTHQELLAKGGFYNELYLSQFTGKKAN